MDAQRSNAIDYVKFIGIMLMLIGHYPNPLSPILRPYVFHMPLFFFLGGMLVNTDKRRSVFYVSLFKRYFIYIIISYIILGVCADLFHYLFGTQKLNVFSGLSTFSLALEENFNNNFFFITGWFLLSYMLTMALCFPLISWVKKINNETKITITLVIIAILLGIFGMGKVARMYNHSKIFYINIISQVMVGSCFYILGYVLRDYAWKIINPVVAFILFIILMIAIHTNITGALYMVWSQYKYGFITHMLSVAAGVYVVLTLANVMSKWRVIDLFKRIGRNSKSIMIFHLMLFTVIDICMSFITDYSINPFDIKQHITYFWSFPVNLVFSVLASMWIGDFLKKLSKGLYA
ncbi:acyltransferase family protein [Kluyvera georgiana]|uniref:acyltransferase family protein n=1 Tax=Kluyvera georgiana TaxID=73098 RepID=UPI003D965828